MSTSITKILVTEINPHPRVVDTPKPSSCSTFFASAKACAANLLVKAKDSLYRNKRSVIDVASSIALGTASTLFSICLDSTPFDKILGGLSCTLCGGCMLLKSGVRKISRMKLSDKNLPKVLARTAIGGALGIYGIAQTILGTLELYLQSQENPRSSSFPTPEELISLQKLFGDKTIILIVL